MAVPTSYDYNGFAGYLKNEVLRMVADAMVWQYEAGADIPAASAQVIQLSGATTDQARSITVDALPTAIYAGNQITFTGHGTTYTVTTDATIGATTVYVFPYVNGVIADNTVGSYTPTQNRNTHPAFRYITDETLLLLGVRNISEISGAINIRKLRMMGRIEAWRAVMSNTVSDVTISEDGGTLQRNQLYQNAVEQHDLAEKEYDALFNVIPETSVPVYIPTQTATVKAVW